MYHSQTTLSIVTFVDAFANQLVLRISSTGNPSKSHKNAHHWNLTSEQVYGLAKGECCHPLTS